MREKVLTLFVFLMGVFSYSLLAQTSSVKGVVTDSEGVPLPGVSVVVKNSSRGISTDFDGNFEIRAEQGDVLVFSSLGFATQEKTVGKDKSKTMKVILQEEAQAIEEVVVVGYGSGRKVGTIVGSVAKVGGKELSQRPSGNAVDALQGKVAGLQIFTSSGEPSALSSIRLHGVGSLGSSSSPLFVVDGVPVSQEAVRSLNQSDFESVSILKDASATSIYGSRAANGVVYITTKRGKTGKGEIMLNTQYGFSNLANREFFDNMMNADELSKFWVETGYRTQKQVDELRAKYPSDTRWDETYFQKNTPTQQADLSISGGTDKTRYYVSGGYFKQKGIMYRSGFERYTFRSNVDTRVNDWMKLGINASVNYYDYITNAYTSNDPNGGLSFLAPPFYSPIDEKGQRYDYIPGWNRYHPEYLAEKNPSNYTGLGVIPTGFIEITPIKNLTFKTQGGFEFTNGIYSFNRLPSYAGDPKNGITRRRSSRDLRKTLTNTLEYKFDLSKNHFMVLLGHEVVSQDDRSFQAEGRKLIDDNLLLLRHSTTDKEITENRSFNITKSIFGRIEYDYDRKYFFDFSLRRDGSSKFSPNNKYGTFWAVGAMWKMKKEKFLSDISAINNLDLKFSAGTSGNSAIGDYTHQALTSANQYGGSTSWAIRAAGNPNLTWENQAKYTLSVDASLFNRASLSLEFYNRITTDMLMDIPTAYTTGFSSIKQNVGKLQNLGLGMSLSVDVYKNKSHKAHFSPYVTFSYNREKVLEIFQNRESWYRSGYGYGYVVGQPVKFFYPVFKGINSENGNPEWYLPSENIAEETRDEARVANSFNSERLTQNTGINRYAPINGGFGFSAAYKALSLQVDFSFSQGKYLINNDRYFSENPTSFQGYNQSKVVQDYWKKPGDQSRFPKWGTRFTEFDTRLLENASFIRMKNVTLAYTLPNEILKQVGFFNEIRFYTTGRNLLTWTKYTGPDPEIDSNRALGANPNTRQYVFGVEVKF